MYGLLGAPERLTVQTSPEIFNIMMSFPRMNKVDERPVGFPKT
jgi:hypothetical protein